MWCVYRHIAPNGKMYVGITGQRPERRYRNGAAYSENKHFMYAIQKYGWDNFKHEILMSNLTRKQAELAERLFIGYWKANDRRYGYNKDAGGICGDKMSEETKRKLSIAHTGRRLSEATKRKIGLKSLGRKHTNEAKDKIRKVKSKSVAMYDRYTGDLLQIFPSSQEASRHTKITQSTITQCCKGDRKGTKIYTWRYANDAPSRLSQDEVRRINKHNTERVVIRYDKDGETTDIFSSIDEASQCTGVHRNTISRYLRGIRTPEDGSTWKYYKEGEKDYEKD